MRNSSPSIRKALHRSLSIETSVHLYEHLTGEGRRQPFQFVWLVKKRTKATTFFPWIVQLLNQNGDPPVAIFSAFPNCTEMLRKIRCCCSGLYLQRYRANLFRFYSLHEKKGIVKTLTVGKSIITHVYKIWSNRNYHRSLTEEYKFRQAIRWYRYILRSKTFTIACW